MTGWFWLSLCGDKNISRLQKTQLLYVSHVHTHGDRGHLQMKISETNELFVLHGHLDRLCIKAWLFICNLGPGPQTRPIDSSISGQGAWKCVQSASCTVEYRGDVWFPKSKVPDVVLYPLLKVTTGYPLQWILFLSVALPSFST